jgi:hypothetical protein
LRHGQTGRKAYRHRGLDRDKDQHRPGQREKSVRPDTETDAIYDRPKQIETRKNCNKGTVETQVATL